MLVPFHTFLLPFFDFSGSYDLSRHGGGWEECVLDPGEGGRTEEQRG